MFERNDCYQACNNTYNVDYKHEDSWVYELYCKCTDTNKIICDEYKEMGVLTVMIVCIFGVFCVFGIVCSLLKNCKKEIPVKQEIDNEIPPRYSDIDL